MASVPLLPTAPAWFQTALDVPFDDEVVEVDDAPIHYLAWGERGRRGLVFVHGGGAHAHWWTHVAATFAEDFRVVAVDLSGHGDSAHRARYDIETWTDEVMAAAGHAGIEGRPVIVGHSMGGFVTIATAARHCDRLSGVIVVDSPVREPDPEVESARLKEAFGAPRTYRELDDGLGRFRTIPEQAHYLDYVMDHVGRRSLKPVDGGFQWKFDRRVFEQFDERIRALGMPYLAQVTCRFALLRAEHGLVTPDIGAAMYEVLGRVAPVIELPEAGHHPMLDVPLVLLTAIRTLLADWDHSEPHRRPTGAS
ncbi:alpha/beta fold hydrolase [Rhabdothermincola salaria]|uniref:alpha/beta fold hydrolase n=1 Tax=Rhabdothermincola salaria TaxID=2903142 RepID=UPI001E366937|nr:alpha/beta hydrolase [Rhabdothermincola salaria]MCD9625113.1 alpha/beta hydrolase [Rhabdothermincola salaria]